MKSQTTTTSQPLTVTVLAALWVSLGRCGVPEIRGPLLCDNGKLSLEGDLPAEGAFWYCPGFMRPEFTQRRPSIDTVYDPVPATQICMDRSIFYNHTIPNSGAYRPVRAERGEYLYCPPQRWLNNLHHGATVLLYHPCAPLHDRLLLSELARSCLPDYVITSHLQLSKHMPLALVSWGHTLELSTISSSDICGWLETTASTRNKLIGVSQSEKYNLLLTWSAEQQDGQPEGHSHLEIKESLRQCCEQTISSLLNGAMETELEPNMKNEIWRKEEEGKSRQIRAALREKEENVKDENDVQNYNSTLGPSADSPSGKRTPSDSPGPREAHSQSKIQNTNQGMVPRPTIPLGSETTHRSDSLGFRASGSQKSRLQKAVQQPSPKHTDLRKPNPSAGLDVLADGVNSEHDTTRPEALALSFKDEGTDSAKQRDKDSVKHSLKENVPKETNFDKDNRADGAVKDNEVVDVKERELEHTQTHSDTHSHHKSDKIGFDSVSTSQPEGSGAAVMNKGFPSTPRTDEAMWAAAALGFLLILLAVSVLHTRLYRHWRTMPSLYWHNPQQDYDSVADVIRRRLRISNKRRKRGRRQECALLPSSSSSDEDP
ncbi:uncharacterized protein tp53i13 isoform X1 [Sebastes fasciatus]|uniref:uncharacterized protein tp53i13 isoform X1 n=1 Tax=Sebastes fasciatus TaxID=394691 RepID=UPI003D9EF68C